MDQTPLESRNSTGMNVFAKIKWKKKKKLMKSGQNNIWLRHLVRLGITNEHIMSPITMMQCLHVSAIHLQLIDRAEDSEINKHGLKKWA